MRWSSEEWLLLKNECLCEVVGRYNLITLHFSNLHTSTLIKVVSMWWSFCLSILLSINDRNTIKSYLSDCRTGRRAKKDTGKHIKENLSEVLKTCIRQIIIIIVVVVLFKGWLSMINSRSTDTWLQGYYDEQCIVVKCLIIIQRRKHLQHNIKLLVIVIDS